MSRPPLKRLEALARESGASLLGALLRRTRLSPEELGAEFRAGRIRKLLLVRTYQGLGDLLCATPVIANLKAAVPSLDIQFLANTFNRAAVEGNPRLSKVWAWSEKLGAEPLGWLRLLRGLRAERFDAALVLSGNALSLTSVMLARLSGARLVAGYEAAAYGKSWGSLLDCEVPFAYPKKEIDKFLGLIAGLGLPHQARRPEYFPSPEDERFAQTFHAFQLPKGEGPLVGIFLGGKVDRPERIWPPQRYAAVARSLAEQPGARILAIAPPQPKAAAHRREGSVWLDEDVHERSFREALGRDCPLLREGRLGRVAAVLKRLDLLICPDGGIMHLAAAVGAPTLALFFGTDPEVWQPPVETSRFLVASSGPASLEVETVADKARLLLSQRVGR